MSLYFAGVWCIEEHNTSIAPQRMRDQLINIILVFDPDLKAFKQWLKDVGIQTNKDATERLKMIRNETLVRTSEKNMVKMQFRGRINKRLC